MSAKGYNQLALFRESEKRKRGKRQNTKKSNNDKKNNAKKNSPRKQYRKQYKNKHKTHHTRNPNNNNKINKYSSRRSQNTNNNNHNNNERRIMISSFEDILNGIQLCPHKDCHYNACCCLHCDAIPHSRKQSSHLRISFHLANLLLNDEQLIVLTKQRIIPLLTNYINNYDNKHKNTQHTINNRVTMAIFLNDNLLFGHGCVPLLNFIKKHDFRITSFQIYKNCINDTGCKLISDIFSNIKYPPNEIHFSHNKITNIGFNSIIDFVKIRNENGSALLSYPLRYYRIKYWPSIQDTAPLWLRIDNNYIKIDDAKAYMQENNITVCYALNFLSPKFKTNDTNHCDAMHCVMDNVVKYYDKHLIDYKQKGQKEKYSKHLNSKCRKCEKLRKGKKRKVVICNRCLAKAKFIDREQTESDLSLKVEEIMQDKKMSMDQKIKAMEAIAAQQDIANKKQEHTFNKTVVNKEVKLVNKAESEEAKLVKWVWGQSDDEKEPDNIQEIEENVCAEKKDEETESAEKKEEETESEENVENEAELFENEFFMQSICELPPNYDIAMLHLQKFDSQRKAAITNKIVTMALADEKETENEKDNKIEIEKAISYISNDDDEDNICCDKSEYLNNMIDSSSTPLFIMCDTNSILRMVSLPRKSAMNYWETMLTHTQKIQYVLHFSIREILHKEKFLSSSEMYKRKLRIEILPALQLHLNTDEIHEIGEKLIKVPFKVLLKSKNKNKVYCDSNAQDRNIIIAQMYRFSALFADKFVGKKIGEQSKVIRQYIFNDIGYECPPELLKKFKSLTSKYSKQYHGQNTLESGKIFTLNTLIEKAEQNAFGFNNDEISKCEQTCVLIPHTVTLELEHIKKDTSRTKTKGDLWRVQKLCGSGGLLERLCVCSGCDILGSEQGEAHLQYKYGKKDNDFTIISIAKYYSTLLNNEHNLGFVLITNDKAMYTIACGKHIPVVSLDTLNGQLQREQGDQAWNASYLRKVLSEVGFVGGFVKKHLIKNAVNLLKTNKINHEKNVVVVDSDESEVKKAVNSEEDMLELEIRRKQVENYMAMERGYAYELFSSVMLTNDLIVTLQDILKNRDSTAIMQQIYKNKVANLQSLVRNSHKKWSQIINDFQSRYNDIAINETDDNDNNEMTGNEADDNEEKKEKKETNNIYLDDTIPEIKMFHADDVNDVNAYDLDLDLDDVNAYDINDDLHGQNEEEPDPENDDKESDDSVLPPPLNDADQEKLFEIQQNLNNNKDENNKEKQKAKVIDREQKYEAVTETDLSLKVEEVIQDKKMSMDKKFEAMQEIAAQQGIANKKQEHTFNKTVVNKEVKLINKTESEEVKLVNKPVAEKKWIWGESEDENESEENVESEAELFENEAPLNGAEQEKLFEIQQNLHQNKDENNKEKLNDTVPLIGGDGYLAGEELLKMFSKNGFEEEIVVMSEQS